MLVQRVCTEFVQPIYVLAEEIVVYGVAHIIWGPSH